MAKDTKKKKRNDMLFPEVNNPIGTTEMSQQMKMDIYEYGTYIMKHRAIPRITDGFLTGEGRVVYGMYDLNNVFDGPYRKSARAVGHILGSFHPHGDSALYGTMVKMSQPWKSRLCLVDIHGSNGNITGDGAAAMRYCVVGETVIKTSEGTLPVEQVYDMYESSKEKDLTVLTEGLRIKSAFGKWNNVSKIFNCGKHPVKKMLLRNGQEIIATGNHPVLTIDSYGATTWKMMDNLSVGDFVVIDFNGKEDDINLREPELTDIEAKYMGAMVSEGFVTTEDRVGINNKCKKFLDVFSDFILSNYGIKPSIGTRMLNGSIIYEALITSTEEHRRLLEKENFGRYSNLRRISSKVLSANLKKKSLFLSYLFEGDGSVNIRYRNKKFNSGSIQYTSNSELLVKDVATILHEFGITTTFSKSIRKNGLKEFRVSISSIRSLRKFKKHINFIEHKKMDKLCLLINKLSLLSEKESTIYILTNLNRRPFSQEIQTYSKFKKNYKNLTDYEKNTLTSYYSNHRAVEVVSIEDAGEQVVYSPKVESECHSYISNGIVSHNTETRLSKYSKFITDDLKYDTVDMIDNFDGTTKEPSELPSRFPLLLINGSKGIIIGFSSSFLPHNPYDVIKLCKEYNLNRKMPIEEMISILKAPDFPTGGVINGLDSIRRGYMEGNGSCRVRGTVEHFENDKGFPVIDITTLPPATNHDKFKERLFELYQSGKIKLKEKIMDLTNGDGVRIRLVLKKDEDPKRVENLLYKRGGLEASSNMTHFALVDGAPRDVTLEDMVREFILFRERVVYRRAKFKQNKAEDDLHLQKGLKIAFGHIDEIIKIIRKSDNDKEALDILIKKFKLSVRQGTYILDMRLRKLTSLESDVVEKKIKELEKEIEILSKITKSKSNSNITKIIDGEFDELFAIFKKDGIKERTCSIIETKKEISVLDAIKDEPRTLVYTRNGRLKNMDTALNPQGRNGTGSSFISQEDDDIDLILPTTTTSNVLIFTDKGKVFTIQPYKIPVSTKATRGALAKSLIDLGDKERIIYMQSVPREYDPKNKALVFVTKDGMIKKTKYEEYTSIRNGGKRAIKLMKDDTLVSVHLYDDSVGEDLLLSTYEGYSIRISGTNLTLNGRDATGVRGVKLKNKNDRVVSGIILGSDTVIFINEEGYIKKVNVSEFNKQARGGYGVLSGSKLVSVTANENGKENVSIFTKQSMNINILKTDIRKISRTSIGVKSIKLYKGDRVIRMFEN